jgi:hypothetical protein
MCEITTNESSTLIFEVELLGVKETILPAPALFPAFPSRFALFSLHYPYIFLRLFLSTGIRANMNNSPRPPLTNVILR